jgi:hypothetical protein
MAEGDLLGQVEQDAGPTNAWLGRVPRSATQQLRI